MLEFIRNRAQGVIAWIIVGFISIAFALWGVENFINAGGGPASVASVNGADITVQDLNMATAQQRNRLEQMFGDNYNPDMFPEEQLRNSALQGLIKDELLRQSAQNADMVIGKKQLHAAIREIQAFYEGGMFSQEKYEQVLSQQGFSHGAFADLLRKDLLTAQLRGAITQSDFVTHHEVAEYLRLKNQQRSIAYASFDSSSYLDKVEVDDAEIEEFYNSNPDLYAIPEKVQLQYLELSLEQMAEGIELSEEDLAAAYEEQKENYKTPEERRASHILVSVPVDAGEEDVQTAKDKIKQAQERLAAGEEFAAVAKEVSDDTLSAEKGGDLDFFSRSQMVPEFADAAFSQVKGEVGQPVRSEFGYHLIKVTDIRGGEVKPLEEIKDLLSKDTRYTRAYDAFDDRVQQLPDLVYQYPDTLQPAADALGLEIKSTDFFGRAGGVGIAANADVIKEAFSDSVLKDGLNSTMLDLNEDHHVVIRLQEHQPAGRRPLEEVKEAIANKIKNDKAAELAKVDTEAFNSALQEGATPEELAADKAVEWKSEDAIKRDQQGVPREIVKAAFALAKPLPDVVSSQVVAMRGGSYAAVVLTGVFDPDPSSFSKEEQEQAKETLLRDSMNTVLAGYIDLLQQNAEIKQGKPAADQ